MWITDNGHSQGKQWTEAWIRDYIRDKDGKYHFVFKYKT